MLLRSPQSKKWRLLVALRQLDLLPRNIGIIISMHLSNFLLKPIVFTKSWSDTFIIRWLLCSSVLQSCPPLLDHILGGLQSFPNASFYWERSSLSNRPRTLHTEVLNPIHSRSQQKGLKWKVLGKISARDLGQPLSIRVRQLEPFQSEQVRATP